jgi:hypothetical protein
VIGIDIESHEKEKNIMIIEDITKTYFGSGHDFLFFLDKFNKQKEERGIKGISLIADMGIFFHFQNNTSKDALINFESSLPANFDSKLKRFCNYHKRDFDRLEEQEKQDLLEHHYREVKVFHPIIDE